MNTYDLVVIGGGTAGCAAAYTAGKLGLKTLLIEKNIHLGGTITSGLVVPVMKSGDNQINTEFYNDLVSELESIGGQVTYQGNSGWFNPELMKIALDALISKANVEVLFNTNIVDVTLTNNVIDTITICKEKLSVYSDAILNENSELFEPIAARYIIDSTGDCEFAKICNCNFINSDDEFQPTNLRFIMSGVDLKTFSDWLSDYDKDRNVTSIDIIDNVIHLSTAYTWDNDKKWALAPLFEDAVVKGILKDTDRNYFQIFSIAGMPTSIAFNCPRIIDFEGNINTNNISNILIEGRKAIYRLSQFCKIYLPGFKNAYISNIADMLGIRTSRRILGKYIYTIDDLRTGKKFANPVLISNYPVDIHSAKKDLSQLERVNEYQLPLESLMSADIDNLFVVGRSISADFLAQGALRVQASCFSMGEGVAKHIADLVKN